MPGDLARGARPRLVAEDDRPDGELVGVVPSSPSGRPGSWLPAIQTKSRPRCSAPERRRGRAA